MHDDEMMERLLHSAMASAVPQVSSGFDVAVLRRVRPRRLSRSGLVLLVTYGLAATAATAWLLRGLDPAVIATGVSAGLATAVGAGAYVQRLITPN